MNDKYSTTEGKTSEKLSDEAMLSAQWKNIDWHKAEQEVNRLQIRIVKATQQKNYNAVKRLQYLLTHSFYAKALAVKRVVTNDGRKTPGVDGVLWNTPAKKMKAVLSLTDKGYRARPLRRVYIEKKDKKKKRPLGIPTMYDRAMQALYALALEPVAETTADGKSFGFRKGRCAQDACEYLFNALSRKHISPKWVLEGDIKGCFDHISHDWLLANIPMDKNILKQFLKAGFIYQRELFPTEEGTPQGGIISPILANMTLDGIEKKLVERFHTNALGKVDSRFKNAHKVNFVRYADDFVVTAATPELALEAKELIREFLAERGLELSDEKTVVTNIDDGFDFLGWNFRKYNEKLIIRNTIRGLQRWIADLNEKKQLLLDALEKAKEPTLSDLLVDYFNLRNEQRSDWSGKAKLKCTVRDFEEVKRAVDYLKTHSLNTVEDLDTAISNLNQTAAPLRRQLKQNENRIRAIAQIKDAAAIHAKLKPIHDTFLKKNFKLTKDAYASQHKEELDAFNKAVRTMMKLNGSTAVDFSALDAEFSALQSSSAELRTQLETLQPDISALKNIRKYIDMVLNKQQLSAPGGKTPEKESVLKQLEQLQQEKSKHKAITPMNREESL